jgi:hypothetical protein
MRLLWFPAIVPLLMKASLLVVTAWQGAAEPLTVRECCECTSGDDRRYDRTFVKDHRQREVVDLKAGFALW